MSRCVQKLLQPYNYTPPSSTHPPANLVVYSPNPITYYPNTNNLYNPYYTDHRNCSGIYIHQCSNYNYPAPNSNNQQHGGFYQPRPITTHSRPSTSSSTLKVHNKKSSVQSSCWNGNKSRSQSLPPAPPAPLKATSSSQRIYRTTSSGHAATNNSGSRKSACSPEDRDKKTSRSSGRKMRKKTRPAETGKPETYYWQGTTYGTWTRYPQQ